MLARPPPRRQGVLDVTMRLATVAGIDAVQSFDPAVALPVFDFIAIERVVGCVAFAEQQPVVARTGGDARAQVRTQAGDPGAIADQQHWLRGGGRVEAGIGAHA